MSDLSPDGPFQVELKIYLTDGKGMTGIASYTMGSPGRLPDKAEIEDAIRSTAGELRDDLRLMTRHEFVRHILAERSGTNISFAVPGPDEFSVEWAA